MDEEPNKEEEEYIHVPDNKFVDELYKRKNGKEFPHRLSSGGKEHLHNLYFPYNTRLARALLKDKHIMYIGDSLIRAMYKDMISLLQTGNLCTRQDLRISNEDSIFGDKHIDVLDLGEKVFRQAREFQSNRHLVQFYFTTRAMREDLEKTCMMMEACEERPDVVVINSAIWDISRYPASMFEKTGEEDILLEEINVAEEYFNRIAMLLRRLRVLLPPTSTVIWVLMPPSSTPDNDAKNSGFLNNNFLSFNAIRMRLLETNVRVAQIVREAGFDVLDLSFHMRSSNYQVFRIKDGVHWNTVATRFMNQLLLGHLASAWQINEEVEKKWSSVIADRVNENRPYFFEAALDFLREVNQDKLINEELQQKVRAVALTNYDDEVPASKSLEQFMELTRTLLTVDKFLENTEDTARTHESAFSGGVPSDLSMFAPEELERIGKMMEECEDRYKGIYANTRMSHTVQAPKRPMIKGSPDILATSPPDSPPPKRIRGDSA